MHQIEWNDELSLGNDLIDTQHKELIRIANVLLKAVEMKRDKRVQDNVLRRLREYTVFHFSAEEALMSDVQYPGRGDHAAEHARLKNEVKAFQRQVYEHEELTPTTLLNFLKQWLLNHILEYDRNLARFIHEKEGNE